MFAVIKTGGKQYRVAAEDVIRIDRVDGEPGDIVEFGEVLVVGGDTPPSARRPSQAPPLPARCSSTTRGDKVIAFKKRRRKNSRRKRGYRHEFSVIRITEILTDGAKPSKTPPPRPKREPKPKPKARRRRRGQAGESQAKKPPRRPQESREGRHKGKKK